MTTTSPERGIPTRDVGALTARGARTREQIRSAALGLFVDPGYRATSLRDIAAAAGLSHPGLLRHYPSKDDILRDLVAEFESVNAEWVRERQRSHAPLSAADLARRNAERPGYLAVFTALVGEATASGHPAHDEMRRRYARMQSSPATEQARAYGAGRDLRVETRRLIAGWDGLQIMQLYAPDRVDVARELDRDAELVARPYADGAPPRPPTGIAPSPLPEMRLPSAPIRPHGNSAGRARRDRILRDATALFAREGYGDTSMRSIAERVGVSKSALFHHYPTKEDLLQAVLSERDKEIGRALPILSATTAAAALREIPDGAARNATAAPGLIEVYTVLSCEATASRHPAHAYFSKRFHASIDMFRALFEAAAADGDLPPHRDPEHEAVWLVALWDGLQIQWLYDRENVDIAAILRTHLEDVLPRR
ncbi:TetR/AcrR family transcriptional regulator [Microbacterium sp. SORGH_AS_0888]|uniref:TetR/AcrR family transcriptional regulator n=1 Tax=Microbacterium sp. SORGH_AS_0888 TaxID=3041791 RepID=UPI00278270EF|nr:TetR/AcrR family transcriptional regulator [Microbacterium sp. SORGH_AS_0888]MDQ1130163.1 AcrR family transcriptional regulator [Microbacterium sp. SORGH_AS_0888]